jgi:glycosyltransferase involved in cell wall biosynthesis
LSNSKIIDQVVNLNKQYLSEEELSLLLFSCDAVFLPYKVSSGSGVMYDGLAHGKPFIASDVGFFKEFSEMNLGIVSKREPRSFEKALVELEKNYSSFESTVNEFRQKINWSVIAKQHYFVYKNALEKQKIIMEISSTKHTNQYP